MIEYKLAWKLTDDQAAALQRETLAIVEFVIRRSKSDPRGKSGAYGPITLQAMVEALAFFIASYTSLEDDDQTAEQILETMTYILERSVRQIRASDAAEKLLARLQARRKRNKRRGSTRDRD